MDVRFDNSWGGRTRLARVPALYVYGFANDLLRAGRAFIRTLSKEFN